MHILALLHIERTDAAVVARRLLQDDARTVHVEAEQLGTVTAAVAGPGVPPLVPPVVVLMVLPDRGRGGRHTLGRAGRLRSEQPEHGRLEEGLVGAGQSPAAQSGGR